MIESFVRRLKRMGIEVEMAANYPWIYLTHINGNQVKEIFMSEHGFTIAFLPLKETHKIKWTDLAKIFRIIRKYK
jgi:hypothetical protein